MLTEEVRVLLKWGGVILLAVMVILFFTGVGKRIKEIFAPTPPPPPTVAFGKLTPIHFPNSPTPSFTYTIDTLTGTLPKFENRANVYKVNKKPADLLALERAKDIVANVGFNEPETKITEAVYEWTETTTPLRKLDLNIFSYDLTLTSEYLFDESITRGINAPTDRKAIDEATSFLSEFTKDIASFDSEKTKTSLFSIVDGKLQPTTSLSSTQVVRVDFYLKDVDKLPVYYANAPLSTNYVYVAGGENDIQIVEAKFSGVELGDSATYPIKTSKQAFEELQKGKAFIATAPPNTKEININKVFLAYFSENKSQSYFMPIIVFGGEGFTAYVSAVPDDWIEP